MLLAGVMKVLSIHTFLNSNNKMKAGTDLKALTFYQMALNSQGHKHRKGLNKLRLRNKEDAATGDAAAATAATADATAGTAIASTDTATTNSTAAGGAGVNSTNVVGAPKVTTDIVITAQPYDLKSCDQVITLTAETIKDHNDYTSRTPAYFTLSAYLVNMFESADTNTLLESINLGHIKQLPNILQGSKNCLQFKDDFSMRNLTMCLTDSSLTEQVQAVYNTFMTCRQGGDLNEFDPVTINNVLSASCNGFNSTLGVSFDMPTIRKQMADELRKGGFEVNEQTTTGAGGFGVANDTDSSDAIVMAPAPKKINVKVPGTPIERVDHKNLVWD
jgi:hypothetical protein